MKKKLILALFMITMLSTPALALRIVTISGMQVDADSFHRGKDGYWHWVMRPVPGTFDMLPNHRAVEAEEFYKWREWASKCHWVNEVSGSTKVTTQEGTFTYPTFERRWRYGYFENGEFLEEYTTKESSQIVAVLEWCERQGGE